MEIVECAYENKSREGSLIAISRGCGFLGEKRMNRKGEKNVCGQPGKFHTIAFYLPTKERLRLRLKNVRLRLTALLLTVIVKKF